MAEGDRCYFCTQRPREEIAIARWHPGEPDDQERLTIHMCGKHMERVRKTGTRGYAHDDYVYKEGWW